MWITTSMRAYIIKNSFQTEKPNQRSNIIWILFSSNGNTEFIQIKARSSQSSSASCFFKKDRPTDSNDIKTLTSFAKKIIEYSTPLVFVVSNLGSTVVSYFSELRCSFTHFTSGTVVFFWCRLLWLVFLLLLSLLLLLVEVVLVVLL